MLKVHLDRWRGFAKRIIIENRTIAFYPVPVLILLVVVLLRTAWVTDDAYITFRTVDNFVSGFGPVWNLGERVQTFTNPLWMFVTTLFYLVTGEMYYTVIVVSILITLGFAVLLAFKSAETRLLGAVGVVALLLSKVFVDFSTSGLENCLTHLLLVLFFIQYFRKGNLDAARTPVQMVRLFGTAALLFVNRLDTFVLLSLPLMYEVYQSENKRRTIMLAALGAAPFIAWEFFSLFYYGFPFPNTAYAKLATGIGAASLAHQGILYFLNLANWDPMTLATIVFASAVGILKRKDRRALFATAGVLLHLLYIIKVGGDHMSGRFFTAPFVVSVVLLTRVKDVHVLHLLPISVMMFVLYSMSPVSTLTTGSEYNRKDIDAAGIADLRGYVYQQTGLLKRGRNHGFDQTGYAKKGLAARNEKVVERKMIGFFGFYAGPKVHIIDPLGLADPLLARLPMIADYHWRVGHYLREIPPGYVETVTSGKNMFKDPNLAQYWERLSLVISGPLWSQKRLAEIWRFNTGQNDALLKEYVKRHTSAGAQPEDDKDEDGKETQPNDTNGNKKRKKN